VQLADVDGDGDLDAVVGLMFEAEAIPTDVVWLEHPVDPEGEWPLHVIGGGIGGGLSLSVHDMDRDGDPDVVVGEHVGSTRLLIYENKGQATNWTPHVVDRGGAEIDHHDGALTVDFDGDGDMDVVSVGWRNQKVWFYENHAVELIVPDDQEAPIPPANLAATAFSSSRVDLRWTPSLDNSGFIRRYEVYRDGSPIGTSAGASFTDDTVQALTPYRWTVVAVDRAGNSSLPSAPVILTTPAFDGDPPSSPGALAATVVSPTRIDLDWASSTDNVGVLGYVVYSNSVAVATQAHVGWIGTGLVPETTYSFAVAAFDAEGNLSDPSQATLQATTPPAATGLWGGWGFDEAAGLPLALDSSGYENHGRLEGNVLRSADGYQGTALQLSGNTGHVNLGPLDIFSDELTIMMWINADDFDDDDARLISKTTGRNEEDHVWMISTWTGPGLRFRLKTDDGITTTLFTPSSPLLGVNEWHHAAATYDGETMRLFIDGVERAQTAKSGPVALAADIEAWIGANPPLGDQVFSGRIDEVRIYGTALTSTQIQAEMTLGLPAAPADETAPTTPTQVSATAVDTSRVDVTWAPSADNLGISAYRVFRDSQLVSTVNSTVYTETGLAPGSTHAFTVQALDYSGNVSELSAPPAIATTPTEDLEPPSVPRNLVASAVYCTRVDLAWEPSVDDVAVTGYRILRDGAEVGMSHTNAFVDTGVAPLSRYGYAVEAVDASTKTSGLSRELEVVTPRVALDPSLAFAYGFETLGGIRVIDNSGQGNGGALESGATRIPDGYVGQGIQLDGVGGRIRIDALEARGPGLTLLAWCRAERFDGSDGILLDSRSAGTEPVHYWTLGTAGAADPTLRFSLTTDVGGEFTLLVTNNLLKTGEWFHVAATFDGDDMRLLINAFEIGRLATVGELPFAGEVPATIGARQDGGQPFAGQMDEVCLFDRALEDSEVLTLLSEAVVPLDSLEIRNTAISGSEIILGGFAGRPMEEYVVLGSTDLARPPGSWSVLSTNRFDATGSFKFTNAIYALEGPRFFRVQAVVSPVPLEITTVTLAGSDLVFEGVGGSPLGFYAVLASADETAPVEAWTVVSTNQFDAIGNFSFTNSLSNSGDFLFYRVLPVVPPTPLKITHVSVLGPTILLEGTGGRPQALYGVLASADPQAPMDRWAVVATNRFNNSGDFSVASLMDSSLSNSFFRIVVPDTSGSLEITSYRLVGSDVILSGSGGGPLADYTVLTSTNITSPVESWDARSTNQFDLLGRFHITNSLDMIAPGQFFRIRSEWP
jgi:chitodextrinase